MKILMLTPYLPYPPASGGQIRTLNLLKYLSKNHEVTLVSLYKNKQEKQYANELQSYCKQIYVCKRPEKPWQINNILKSVFSFLPFLIVRNYSVEARNVVEKLLETEEFDVIHAETFYIMPHIPKTHIPILLVEQTIEYKVYQHFISTLPFLVRTALSLDIFKLKYWETYYWKKANLVSAVSRSDKEIIQQDEPSIAPVIVPNGAGDEMFVDKLGEKNLEKPTILFVGNFSWLQNVEAAEYLMDKIFPQIVEKIPHVRLIIAGQNTNVKIEPKSSTNIDIITIAPDDGETVKKLYRESTLFIAPIYGPGGTRLKILASMAAGLPVVSTKTGIEGLGVNHNEHVLIANSPEQFIQHAITILNNPQLYEHLRKQAFQLVKKQFSWSAIAKKLEIEYKHMTEK